MIDTFSVHDVIEQIQNRYGRGNERAINLDYFNVMELLAVDAAGNTSRKNWLRISDPRLHFPNTPVVFYWQCDVNSWRSKESYFFHCDPEGKYFIVPHSIFSNWYLFDLKRHMHDVEYRSHVSWYDTTYSIQNLNEILSRVALDVNQSHVDYITGEAGSANLYSEAKLRLSRVPGRISSIGNTLGEWGTAIGNAVGGAVDDAQNSVQRKWDEFQDSFGLSEDMKEFFNTKS